MSTTFQPERTSYTSYEKETISPVKRENATSSYVYNSENVHNNSEHVHNVDGGASRDPPPALGVYVKGFGRVIAHALEAYKDLLVDVVLSMWALFLQHPSVGVFCLVTAGFTLAPIAAFIGFSIISAITVSVGALVIEGMLMAGGLFVLLFAVPTSFFTGLGAASTAVSAWIAINAAVKFFRGRDIIDEFVPHAKSQKTQETHTRIVTK